MKFGTILRVPLIVFIILAVCAPGCATRPKKTPELMAESRVLLEIEKPGDNIVWHIQLETPTINRGIPLFSRYTCYADWSTGSLSAQSDVDSQAPSIDELCRILGITKGQYYERYNAGLYENENYFNYNDTTVYVLNANKNGTLSSASAEYDGKLVVIEYRDGIVYEDMTDNDGSLYVSRIADTVYCGTICSYDLKTHRIINYVTAEDHPKITPHSQLEDEIREVLSKDEIMGEYIKADRYTDYWIRKFYFIDNRCYVFVSDDNRGYDDDIQNYPGSTAFFIMYDTQSGGLLYIEQLNTANYYARFQNFRIREGDRLTYPYVK